jgi:hypothetical protein
MKDPIKSLKKQDMFDTDFLTGEQGHCVKINPTKAGPGQQQRFFHKGSARDLQGLYLGMYSITNDNGARLTWKRMIKKIYTY